METGTQLSTGETWMWRSEARWAQLVLGPRGQHRARKVLEGVQGREGSGEPSEPSDSRRNLGGLREPLCRGKCRFWGSHGAAGFSSPSHLCRPDWDWQGGPSPTSDGVLQMRQPRPMGPPGKGTGAPRPSSRRAPGQRPSRARPGLPGASAGHAGSWAQRAQRTELSREPCEERGPSRVGACRVGGACERQRGPGPAGRRGRRPPGAQALPHGATPGLNTNLPAADSHRQLSGEVAGAASAAAQSYYTAGVPQRVDKGPRRLGQALSLAIRMPRAHTAAPGFRLWPQLPGGADVGGSR